jgi:hypothetical protein
MDLSREDIYRIQVRRPDPLIEGDVDEAEVQPLVRSNWITLRVERELPR